MSAPRPTKPLRLVRSDDGPSGSVPGARWSAEALAARIAAGLGAPVEVGFGRARRQVLVARPRSGGWELRLNAGFADAPPEVIDAIARWLAAGRRARRACAVLDAWIAELSERLAREPRRLPPLRHRGRFHDLAPLFAAVLDEDLLPAERAALSVPEYSWGRATRQARRSLQLGSYDADLRLVRIHPVLDQAAVPDWFVRFILFHEVLHALFPLGRADGKRCLQHPPAFRTRESAHPDHARANAWQERHIDGLIRSARRGKPLVARASEPRQGWLFARR